MKIFRKRLIPEECVELKNDEIVYQDQDKIVTRWESLKPREDFSHGYSCYYLKEGYKVSKFLKENEELKCWYCDIIKSEWKAEESAWLFTDLLADVIINKTNSVRVVDLDELAEAFEKGLLKEQELTRALRCLNSLLQKIDAGEFENMTAWIDQTVRRGKCITSKVESVTAK